MVEGQTQNGRQSTVDKYAGGTVHLIASSNEVADSDTDTEVNNKSQASLTTTAGDWTTTVDNTAGTTTLENASELDFGAQSGYTHTQTVVVASDGSGEVLIIPESTSNNFTGETFSYPSGSLTYTLGGE